MTRKASLWFLICGFMQRGISLITTPIFTRLLTTDEYGAYTVYNSWLELFTVVVTLKLGVGAYLQGLVKYDYDQDKYTSSLLGLSTTSVGIWFVFYLIFSDPVNSMTGLSTYLMICMFIMMWSTGVFEFWSAKQRVAYNYKGLVTVTIISVIAKPLLSILLVISTDDYKVEARVTGLAIVEFSLFVGMFVVMMYRGRTYYDKHHWLSALKYNLPLVPHYLSALILAHSDRIMIKMMIDESSAGKYGLAYNVASIVRLFNTSLNNVLIPWTYQSIKKKEYKRIGKYSLILMLLIAVINLVIMAVAPEMIRFFAPKEYYDAVDCIYPVSMAVFFMFMYDTFSKFVMYFEKTKYVMYVSVVSAALNVGLNFLLIPIFGYVAAAYTTLICYIVYGIGHYIFMRIVCKKNGIECPYNALLILLISVAFILTGFLMLLLKELVIVRYATLVAVLVVAFLVKDRIIGLLKQMKKERKAKTVKEGRKDNE